MGICPKSLEDRFCRAVTAALLFSGKVAKPSTRLPISFVRTHEKEPLPRVGWREPFFALTTHLRVSAWYPEQGLRILAHVDVGSAAFDDRQRNDIVLDEAGWKLAGLAELDGRVSLLLQRQGRRLPLHQPRCYRLRPHCRSHCRLPTFQARAQGQRHRQIG